MIKQALLWHKKDNKTVVCDLCPHHCLIKNGGYGLCRIRINNDATLYANGYGNIVSYAIDPIEKKPLYHFYPGKNILSVGANGCNLTCKFCQNWQISQLDQATQYVDPDELIRMAIQYRSFAIAFTYTEPLIWYEYLIDCSERARQEGLKIVLVTNGYICNDAAQQLLPHIDALNIDLKSINPNFYKNTCGGTLEPVLEFIKLAHKQCHIELTNLIIPTLNDSLDDIESLAKFTASLNRCIPVHFSAYYPQYKMDIAPTPPDTLEKVYRTARKYLDYVYLGNTTLSIGNNTYCPKCDNLLIERTGYHTVIIGLKKSICSQCGAKINIIM